MVDPCHQQLLAWVINSMARADCCAAHCVQPSSPISNRGVHNHERRDVGTAPAYATRHCAAGAEEICISL